MADKATNKSPEKPAEMRAYQRMQEEIKGIISVTDATGNLAFDIAADVIDRIAVATSADEIWAANEEGPKDASDYLGQPLGITSIRYYKSAEQFREGTLGYYVVIEAVQRLSNGEEEKLLMSVGAPNIVASLRQLEKIGLIKEGNPFWVCIKGKQTPNGTLYTLHKG